MLRGVGHRLSTDEYALFVNLAASHDDLHRVTQHMAMWRDLTETEQRKLLSLLGRIPLAGTKVSRLARIGRDLAYQLRFHTYPDYVRRDDEGISSVSPSAIDQALDHWEKNLKVPAFESSEQWFAYYGDPTQRPSWFTYLSYQLQATQTKEEAERIVDAHRPQVEDLSEPEKREVRRRQVEKGIETFYADNLDQLEDGLVLVPKGRQYCTVIGPMDLLCRSEQGDYVVVEIKAGEADDATFGQILRYMGWVHRNLATRDEQVRGTILAGEFTDRARYSRIGLLRDDHKEFLKFRRHGLDLETI